MEGGQQISCFPSLFIPAYDVTTNQLLMQLTLGWPSSPIFQFFPPTFFTPRQDSTNWLTQQPPLSKHPSWLSRINKAVVASRPQAGQAVEQDRSNLRYPPQFQTLPAYQLILGEENTPPLNSLAISAGNGGTGRLIARDLKPVCHHLKIPAKPTRVGSRRSPTFSLIVS